MPEEKIRRCSKCRIALPVKGVIYNIGVARQIHEKGSHSLSAGYDWDLCGYCYAGFIQYNAHLERNNVWNNEGFPDI